MFLSATVATVLAPYLVSGFQETPMNLQVAIPTVDPLTIAAGTTAHQSNPPTIPGQAGGATGGTLPGVPVAAGQAAPPVATGPVRFTISTTAEPEDPALKRPVSGRFTNANPADIIAWLESEKVSFIWSDAAIPKDLTVSLNFVNVPLYAAIEAIGEAMGGVFVPRQGIYRYVPRSQALTFPIVGGTAATGFGGGGFGGGGTSGGGFGTEGGFGPIDPSLLIPPAPVVVPGSVPGAPQPVPAPHGQFRSTITIPRTDFKALMASLTPTQREKHRKQGYLRPSDLSYKQRGMLGNISGKYDISVDLNGQKLRIKNP